MTPLTAFAEPYALTGLAIFCRIGGCLLLLPGFSSGRVPPSVRILVVLALAASLTPMLMETSGVNVSPPRDVFALLKLVAFESVIGAYFGLAARFYLLALGFIATTIATVSGFGNIPGASVMDDEPQAAVGTLVTFSALLVLFHLDFHHTVLRALIASYALVPPMTPLSTGALLADLTDVLAQSFMIVLRLGSPFIAYALVANTAIGILNKLTPQIPVYFVSLPFLIAGGLTLLYLVLPTMLILFGEGFGELAPWR